jgi:hypothetical protein
MQNISIKLGKKVIVFEIVRNINGIWIVNPENKGILMELCLIRDKWQIYSAVRELAFFEDDFKEIAIRFIKKNKI